MLYPLLSAFGHAASVDAVLITEKQMELNRMQVHGERLTRTADSASPTISRSRLAGRVGDCDAICTRTAPPTPPRCAGTSPCCAADAAALPAGATTAALRSCGNCDAGLELFRIVILTFGGIWVEREESQGAK